MPFPKARPRPPQRIELNEAQTAALEELAAPFAPGGKQQRHANYAFIRSLIDDGEDRRKFYRPQNALAAEVDLVLCRR